MNYYAHTGKDENGRPLPESRWQPLAKHLRNVAVLARQFAAPIGLSADAELAGLLHDLGKYADRFQRRLRNPNIHGINHWTVGARRAAELRAALVDYTVEGHHTGLPAFSDLHQALKKLERPESARELTGCSESISELLRRFEADELRLPPSPPRRCEELFAAALRTRILFSCLVDADFLDTEQHFDPEAAKQRIVPPLHAEAALQVLRDHLSAKPTDGPVNQLRRRLLRDCLKAAEKPPGLFTLTAPTGSGKTLASLAFALRHIVYHNSALSPGDPRKFRRVIVVIPYTSIIEQTAQVYRELFETKFGSDYVLEHHSAVAPRERKEDRDLDAEEERLRRARLAAENWASPLVVTTSVQFFESLFAHKPSDCRKLHNVARSVLVFDEVQTLPARLAPSLLSAVRLLTLDYGVTAVFMTATQPAFGSIAPQILRMEYNWQPTEIASDPTAFAETLRRTRIELPKPQDRTAWDALAHQLTTHSQVLCVVNTTKDARELFRLLPSENRFHLSARMCPAHRQAKLAEIRRCLDPQVNKPCRLVSTQLIEAGVDVDFPVAFRALGPLDSIIQTAGRCNREGRSALPRPLFVFRPEAGGMPPGAYRVAAAKTEEFLTRHPDARLHAPSLYAAYFAELYRLQGPEAAEADEVFALSARFDFPAAAEACNLIGDQTRAVLVKWQRGEELAERLRREKHLTAAECRQVQRYCVNLYQKEFLAAQARGYIYQPAEGWDFWVWNSDYDEDLGLGHLDLIEPL